MDTLSIELSAALVDNPATPLSRTRVKTSLENSAGRLSVEDCEGIPRSVHRFMVKGAADLGVGRELNADQAARLLALSCSLTTPRVLFSPVQPQHLQTMLEFGRGPSEVKVSDTPEGKEVRITETLRVTASYSILLETAVSLDESKIVDVAGRLRALRVLDKSGRTVRELNIIEAVGRYLDALMSVDALSAYTALYSGMEKAVNADRDRTGRSFDSAAAGLCGISAAEAEELRAFNNRVKHALRSRKDAATLRTEEARRPKLALLVKRSADAAVLARL